MEKEKISGSTAEKLVALNSYVEVHDLKKDQKYTVRLVPPANVNVTSKWISVHSPLGKSLIGKRSGETVSWQAPNETNTLKILRVRDK